MGLKIQVRGKHRKNHLWDWLFLFGEALAHQLHYDEHRHGNIWRELPKEGQEHRVFAAFSRYYANFTMKGQPMPWLRVAGLALICWVRDTKPEVEWKFE